MAKGSVPDLVQHIIDPVDDIPICEPEDGVTVRLKMLGSGHVLCFPVVVNFPIELNDDPLGWTAEVNDEGA